MKTPKYTLWIFVAVFVGVVAGLIISSNFDWMKMGIAADDNKLDIRLGSAEPVSQELMDLQATSKAFVEVAKKVSPAIVTIKSEKVVKQRSWHPFMDDEFFRRFFGTPEDEEQILKGLGSGVIVNSEGYILTNNHVIEEADDIQVSTGGEEYEAKIIGRDPASDIAVIKIEKNDMPTVRFGDSDQLEIGEWVLAIGNPFAEILQNTVTAGIVSAKGRHLDIGGGRLTYQDFIQTDAAINPGNSGGALVNLRGELVGINAAIVGQANVGIGFAIPINLAKDVMDQLINKGKVVRGWLGVQIDPVNENVAKALGLQDKIGVQVPQVIEGSPAEKAGIQASDIILMVDDVEITSPDQLTNLVATYEPGTKVDLTIWRDGQKKVITVELGERPSETVMESSPMPTSDVASQLGLRVQNLTDAFARRYGYENEEGVIVVDVKAGSPADRERIQEGDLITSVDKKSVSNANEFSEVLKGVKENDIVLFRLRRGEMSFFRALRVPKAKEE